MRTAVITGLFAFVLVIGLNSTKTSALSEETTNNQINKSVVAILSLETDSALKVIDEVTSEPENPVEPTPQQKYVVIKDDTLSMIAVKFGITWQRLYDKNVQLVDPNVLDVGVELIIPTSDEVLVPRELPLPPVQQKVTKTITKTAVIAIKRTTADRGSAAGNKYVAGYCTWYVKNRRPDMPNNLGNAATWVSRAASQGMATGSTPQAGAVGQRGNHVVYVESVNGDGTVTISEMNHKGLYVITTRTLPENYFSYIY
jgi:surface antigen